MTSSATVTNDATRPPLTIVSSGTAGVHKLPSPVLEPLLPLPVVMPSVGEGRCAHSVFATMQPLAAVYTAIYVLGDPVPAPFAV